MYKVLIVDDEVLVRVGLKSTIDWESLGFVVVAEAANGEQAYEAYKQHKPQLILTDIRMPKKDGLWLTRKIREENQQVKILMLTCYNDFEYAREALKSGANDYILKSEAEDEELVKVMETVRKNLDMELSEHEKHNKLKKQMDTNLTTLKAKLLEDLLKPDTVMDNQLLSKCSDFGFELNEARFALLTLFRDDSDRRTNFTDQEWQHMNNAIINIASGIMAEGKISYLTKECSNEFLFLLSKKDMNIKGLQESVESICRSVMQYFEIPLSAIISRTFDDIMDVSGVYTDMRSKSQQLFYIDESCVINASERDYPKINIFSIKKSYEQQLINYMDQEDEANALAVVGQTEAFFRQNNVKEMEVKLFYSNIISNIFERYHHCFVEIHEGNDYTYYHNRIMAITKIKNILKLFQDIIFLVIKNIKKYRMDNSNYIIKKAIDFIEKNYDKEISLQSLSAYLNLSKHYVCYLFKKETGDNISLYVNKLRIEKAKQLVVDSNCKIKEIYDKLGFTDQQYFCKIFKRITGMTVMQYRDSILRKS